MATAPCASSRRTSSPGTPMGVHRPAATCSSAHGTRSAGTDINTPTLPKATPSTGRELGAPACSAARAVPSPPRARSRSQAWHAHYTATVEAVVEATLDDLKWADGFALGSPTRYGLPASQLKQFIDQTGPLWMEGHLSNKVATSFTSARRATRSGPPPDQAPPIVRSGAGRRLPAAGARRHVLSRRCRARRASRGSSRGA
jgi:hypothetical protein